MKAQSKNYDPDSSILVTPPPKKMHRLGIICIYAYRDLLVFPWNLFSPTYYLAPALNLSSIPNFF